MSFMHVHPNSALVITLRCEQERYDDRFKLPLINGKPDLRPAKAYQRPYLNADFGSDKISVSVGPVTRVLDFSEQGK